MFCVLFVIYIYNVALRTQFVLLIVLLLLPLEEGVHYWITSTNNDANNNEEFNGLSVHSRRWATVICLCILPFIIVRNWALTSEHICKADLQKIRSRYILYQMEYIGHKLIGIKWKNVIDYLLLFWNSTTLTMWALGYIFVGSISESIVNAINCGWLRKLDFLSHWNKAIKQVLILYVF